MESELCTQKSVYYRRNNTVINCRLTQVCRLADSTEGHRAWNCSRPLVTEQQGQQVPAAGHVRAAQKDPSAAFLLEVHAPRCLVPSALPLWVTLTSDVLSSQQQQLRADDRFSHFISIFFKLAFAGMLVRAPCPRLTSEA